MGELLERAQDNPVSPPSDSLARGEKSNKSRERRPDLSKELASGASIAAVNASGFGAYEGLSVALSAASSSAGVTLPFGAYTASSVALSWATGPVAIGAIGICAIYKLFR